jgi:hypothetical protein
VSREAPGVATVLPDEFLLGVFCTGRATSTNDGQTWQTPRISTRSWNPDLGFFTSGAFIGDYNGIAASNRVVYPVWTDGRNNAIGQTGIGETDIFTNVELR